MSEQITVYYRASDGFRKTYRYRTIEGARTKVKALLGEYFDIGTSYAVSGDGVGRVTLKGATFEQLGFGEKAAIEAQELNLEELQEAIYAAEESLGETIAQHRAETAQFGDSWPGAQIQIREGQEYLAKLIARLPPLPPVEVTPDQLDEIIEDDENSIPF